MNPCQKQGQNDFHLCSVVTGGCLRLTSIYIYMIHVAMDEGGTIEMGQLKSTPCGFWALFQSDTSHIQSKVSLHLALFKVSGSIF
jgi:hypothetical protein